MIESKEVILSIGGTTMTSESCVIESMTVTQDSPVDFQLGERFEPIMREDGLTSITLKMKCLSSDFLQETCFGKKEQQQIRNKKVDDCTIQELLFAVRQKSKGEKQC